jgi:hypothetical protein
MVLSDWDDLEFKGSTVSKCDRYGRRDEEMEETAAPDFGGAAWLLLLSSKAVRPASPLGSHTSVGAHRAFHSQQHCMFTIARGLKIAPSVSDPEMQREMRRQRGRQGGRRRGCLLWQPHRALVGLLGWRPLANNVVTANHLRWIC